ncbi:MAG: alpha/beta fold hydrolase [Rhodospirillaceae bacterium]
MGRNGVNAGRVHRAYAWAENGQIHYRRAGPAGARSPLLLLHGLHGSSAPLEDFMSEMGRERSVIAPDLPGTGMSDPLHGKPDAAAHAGAMLQVVAELGLGMVDVIAVKDGGEIAVEMARQQPDVVRKIILVSAPPPRGLLSQPTLALDMPAFPGENPDTAAAAVRDFLDH